MLAHGDATEDQCHHLMDRQAVDRWPCTGNVISKEWHKEAQQGYQSNARQRYCSHRGGGMSRTHTHTAAQQRQGAPACRQSANVGPPAERHQSASVVPLRRRCKQDLSGCACLAWCTALWVCSVTYRRCFATNAPDCGQEQTCPPKADVTQPLHHQSWSKHR